MTVSLSIYGTAFKAYEFLLEAKELPGNIMLWDPEECVERDHGFTLVFEDSKRISSLPFALGRFLLSNKELLRTNEFYCADTVKDLTFHFTHKELQEKAEEEITTVYIFNPGLMKLFSELKIHFYISRTD